MEHIFSNIGTDEYGAFIFFALFGMLLVKLIRYRMKKKRAWGAISFSCLYWLDDNITDVLITALTAFSFYRFFPDALSFLQKLVPAIGGYEEKMFYGLLLGIILQYANHRLLNKIKLSK